jgi:hypothetical protein
VVLPDLGDRGIEMLRSEIPDTLDTSEGVSEADKMLLNCLEHVSRARVCCMIYRATLIFSFSLRV